jgi:hypothetical protein
MWLSVVIKIFTAPHLRLADEMAIGINYSSSTMTN